MRCALIGRKLGHSHSQRIHEALGGYGYECRPVEPENLMDLLHSPQYDGFNVTIPYKQDAMAACTRLDPLVERIGALNTVVRQADGSNWGYNTDYPGFLALADRAGIRFAGRKALVLGSGGTSRTVRTALADRGAKEVLIVSRNGEVNYNTISRHHDAQILINTTPCGMYPNLEEQALSLEGFSSLEGVIDVIYNPLRTNLILEAQQRGISCTGGLYMLVAQARHAGELFLNRSICEERMELVYRELARDLSDLVLIGMPGSGKTTLGRMAAQTLGREFVDVDQVIETQAGMTIPEIFAKEGEAGFRARERSAIEGLCKTGGRVIAAGGGAPLDPANRRAFRRNGCVVYLDRDTAMLPRQGRPLSERAESLERMKQQRLGSYLACADTTVVNKGRPEEVLTAILEEFDAYFDR